MKVPNISRGMVSREKVIGYLLTMPPIAVPLAPPLKGPIFRGILGFTDADWQELAARLHRIGMTNEVVSKQERERGINYRVEGVLEGLNGRQRLVRTIWFIETGSDVPRLVSAF